MKRIIEEAKENRACKPFLDGAYNLSVRDACDWFFAESSWAFEAGIPSASAAAPFSEEALKYGFAINKDLNLRNSRQLAIFGSSEVSIEYTDYSVGQLFVKHVSRLKVIARGHSRVFVTVGDFAEVETEATENAKIFVYRKSETCTIVEK